MRLIYLLSSALCSKLSFAHLREVLEFVGVTENNGGQKFACLQQEKLKDINEIKANRCLFSRSLDCKKQ